MDSDKKTLVRGQIFSVEDGNVVVEWYHFGENVAYEFAVQLWLDQSGQSQFARALGLSEGLGPDAMCDVLKKHFSSYFAVREFADANAVPYELRRDLRP